MRSSSKYPDSEYAERRAQEDRRSRATRSPARRCRSAATIWSAANIWRRSTASRSVVEEYQTTRHVEEALHRLTESYLALGIVPEAQTAAAVLGHNFPDSEWYQDSYALLGKGGLEPSENKRLLDVARLPRRTRTPVAFAGNAGQPHSSRTSSSSTGSASISMPA